MNKDLIEKLLEASNLIHKRATRGSGNFLVTSQQVASSFTIMYVGERIEKCKKILSRIRNGKAN
jgi:hypothetical protein